MEALHPRRAARAAAAALLIWPAACTTSPLPNVTVPGFGVPGVNRPPVFVSQSLTRDPAGFLRLQANAVDLDGDGLVITYEQIAGPTVVERSAFRVGGALNVTFNPPADAVYAFRLIASDGFFNSDIRVSTSVVTPPPPGFDPTTNAGVGSVPNPAFGTFSVNITGQVTDAGGNLSFSQPAVVRITAPPLDYAGTNPVVIEIDTTIHPALATNATGALTLRTLANRAGHPTDGIALTQFGAEIDLADAAPGAPLANGQAGLFRAGPSADGALYISQVDAFLRTDGNILSGTLLLLDPTTFAQYSAQLSGTRN